MLSQQSVSCWQGWGGVLSPAGPSADHRPKLSMSRSQPSLSMSIQVTNPTFAHPDHKLNLSVPTQITIPVFLCPFRTQTNLSMPALTSLPSPFHAHSDHKPSLCPLRTQTQPLHVHLHHKTSLSMPTLTLLSPLHAHSGTPMPTLALPSLSPCRTPAEGRQAQAQGSQPGSCGSTHTPHRPCPMGHFVPLPSGELQRGNSGAETHPSCLSRAVMCQRPSPGSWATLLCERLQLIQFLASF